MIRFYSRGVRSSVADSRPALAAALFANTTRPGPVTGPLGVAVGCGDLPPNRYYPASRWSPARHDHPLTQFTGPSSGIARAAYFRGWTHSEFDSPWNLRRTMRTANPSGLVTPTTMDMSVSGDSVRLDGDPQPSVYPARCVRRTPHLGNGVAAPAPGFEPGSDP